ncbi:MAG: nucleotidyltransferase family protein [Hyphomicrobium sp.]
MAEVAAVLLAAGASTRFGTANKLVAEINGLPLVRAVADAVLDAGVAELVVVTGSEPGPIERALDGLSIRFIHNARWQDGMGSSIAAGVAALRDRVDAGFIVPGDMPLLTVGLLRSLITAFERHSGAPIVYTATPDGAQRNPVLWPSRLFPELRALSGPAGAKALLRPLLAESVAVACDPVIFIDIDTPADLLRAAVLTDAAGLDPTPPNVPQRRIARMN